MISGPGGPSYRSGLLIEKIPPFGECPWNEKKTPIPHRSSLIAAKSLHGEIKRIAKNS
jgi:hypothetical protein